MFGSHYSTSTVFCFIAFVGAFDYLCHHSLAKYLSVKRSHLNPLESQNLTSIQIVYSSSLVLYFTMYLYMSIPVYVKSRKLELPFF